MVSGAPFSFVVGISCYLCALKQGIRAERGGARKQRREVENMNASFVRRFYSAEVGDTVMVPIPLIDLGRLALTSAKVVVIP